MESTREVITFPLGDLPEDTQGEVFSHLSELDLPIDVLLQARTMNKKLAAAATRALFYKRNRSALFVQSVLLNQELIGDSAIKFATLDLLRTCLCSAPLNTVEMTQILVLMGRLVNLKISWDWSAEKQAIVKNLILLPHHLVAREKPWQLIWIHIAVSSRSIALDYLPFIIERIKENDDLDKENAIRAFHSIVPLLDPLQLLIYLGEIKAATSAARNYYWSLKNVALWQPILKKISEKLGAGFIASYTRLIMIELKNKYTLFNVLILSAFASQLSVGEIPSWLTKLLIDNFKTDESAIVSSNVIAALASNNLITKIEIQDSLIAIIQKFSVTNNHDVRRAVINAARTLAAKVDNPLVVQLLENSSNVEKAFLLACVAPVLSMKQILLNMPDVLGYVEKKGYYVAYGFLIFTAMYQKLEPELIDRFIEKMLVYFNSDIASYVKLADEWLLTHWEQLSVSNRTKCYLALQLAIETQLTSIDSMQDSWQISVNTSIVLSRLRFVSTLLSPEEAKSYLTIALTKIERMNNYHDEHFLSCLAGLYAIIVRMNKEDVKNRVADIIRLIPTRMLNFTETINLLSYFIVNDICSLDELKKMSALGALDTDYSLPLLEKMAEWHAEVGVGWAECFSRSPTQSS